MARQSAAAEAAQSVRSMAGMLAHGIKNPLAGIRGAAQLLESKLGPADGALAALIREESDRIVGLVIGVEIFADDRAPVLSIVNVHEALDHVCKLARVSFARHVTLREYYDPSLPPISGMSCSDVQPASDRKPRTNRLQATRRMSAPRLEKGPAQCPQVPALSSWLRRLPKPMCEG